MSDPIDPLFEPTSSPRHFSFNSDCSEADAQDGIQVIQVFIILNRI